MDELDDAVNDIISQLKGHNQVASVVRREEDEIATTENLEEFLITKTSKLISKSLSIVDNVNDYISSAPDNRDVSAMAELIKASSAAIDTLTKLHTAKESNINRKEVKQMDVDAKERMNIADNQTRVLLSREDIMKAIIDKDDSVIDV